MVPPRPRPPYNPAPGRPPRRRRPPRPAPPRPPSPACSRPTAWERKKKAHLVLDAGRHISLPRVSYIRGTDPSAPFARSPRFSDLRCFVPIPSPPHVPAGPAGTCSTGASGGCCGAGPWSSPPTSSSSSSTPTRSSSSDPTHAAARGPRPFPCSHCYVLFFLTTAVMMEPPETVVNQSIITIVNHSKMSGHPFPFALAPTFQHPAVNPTPTSPKDHDPISAMTPTPGSQSSPTGRGRGTVRECGPPSALRADLLPPPEASPPTTADGGPPPDGEADPMARARLPPPPKGGWGGGVGGGGGGPPPPPLGGEGSGRSQNP